MSYQTLALNREGPVLSIALNRPEVRNAFNDILIKELGAAFACEASEPSVRVVVLKGNGQVFCAGGDLNWMKKAVDFTYDENLRDTRSLAHMFGALNEFPKPVIGLVHGAAIGGGVGLVSICDTVIATSDCVFSLSEVRLGVVPACIGPFVIAKIGASHARRLFLSADRFGADEARAIHLVHEVAKDMAGIESAAKRILSNILQCGPNAMAVAKRLVLDLSWPERRMVKSDPLEYVACTLADIRVTPEAQEGVRAFLEKRKPSWL